MSNTSFQLKRYKEEFDTSVDAYITSCSAERKTINEITRKIDTLNNGRFLYDYLQYSNSIVVNKIKKSMEDKMTNIKSKVDTAVNRRITYLRQQELKEQAESEQGNK